MLTLIHGDDTAASRTFFLNAKKRSVNPVTLDADSLSVTDLHQTLSGSGLFAEEKAIFIESLLTKKKKGAELSAMLEALKQSDGIQIFLWEGKEVDKKTITSLGQATTQIFTLPKSLFLLLDNLKPNNPSAITLFHKTLEQVEVEMVFFMIIRQLRLLLAVSARDGDPIDEVRRMQPWQRTKLEKQNRTFKPEMLTKHYIRLAEIDLAQKTGTLPRNLISSIDFWLLDL